MKHFIRLLAICSALLAVVVLADAVNLNLNGKTSSIDGFLDNNVLFVSPKGFLSVLGASVLSIEPGTVTIRQCEKVVKLPFVIHNRAPFVNGVATATALGFQASQNGLILNVTGLVPDCKPAATTNPGTGYKVTIDSSITLKGDGGGWKIQLRGSGLINNARSGAVELFNSDVPTAGSYTILAEGFIPMQYASINWLSPKCSLTAVNGSQIFVMVLSASTTQASGKIATNRVIAVDPGFVAEGGVAVPPSENLSCPPAPGLGTSLWYDTFSADLKANLGAALLQSSPKPMLLFNDLIPTLETISLRVGTPTAHPLGKASISTDTLFTFTPVK